MVSTSLSFSLLLNVVSYFSHAKLSITHLKHLYHLKLEKFERITVFYIPQNSRVIRIYESHKCCEHPKFLILPFDCHRVGRN